MKAFETIKKIITQINKVYSRIFDATFDLIFGSFKANSMMDRYCNENYYMTSGGSIRRDD